MRNKEGQHCVLQCEFLFLTWYGYSTLPVILTVSVFQRHMELMRILECHHCNDSFFFLLTPSNCLQTVRELLIINMRPSRPKLTLYNSCNHSFWISPTYKIRRKSSKARHFWKKCFKANHMKLKWNFCHLPMKLFTLCLTL